MRPYRGLGSTYYKGSTRALSGNYQGSVRPYTSLGSKVHGLLEGSGDAASEPKVR